MAQHHPYPALPIHPATTRTHQSARPHGRVDWSFLAVFITGPAAMLTAAAADIPTARKWFLILLVVSVLAGVVAWYRHRDRIGPRR